MSRGSEHVDNLLDGFVGAVVGGHGCGGHGGCGRDEGAGGSTPGTNGATTYCDASGRVTHRASTGSNGTTTLTVATSAASRQPSRYASDMGGRTSRAARAQLAGPSAALWRALYGVQHPTRTRPRAPGNDQRHGDGLTVLLRRRAVHVGHGILLSELSNGHPVASRPIPESPVFRAFSPMRGGLHPALYPPVLLKRDRELLLSAL
jgi:hypothetical protein